MMSSGSNKRTTFDIGSTGSAFYTPKNKRFCHGSGNSKQTDTPIDMIIKLGDTGSRIEDNLCYLMEAIDSELVDNNKKEKENIIQMVCKCCVSFPSKVTVYATLIGLINEKSFNTCEDIIDILCSSYSLYLKEQKWKEALTIVHIFANLVNCGTIRNTSLLAMFETLLEVTLEDNSTQARSDYYVYTVLSSLMYVGRDLSQTKTQDLEQIMNTINNFISRRQKVHLNALRVWLSNDPMIQTEYMDSLWAQISNLKDMNWTENVIDRPYNIPVFQEKINGNLTHNLPPILVPVHDPSTFYPYPRVIFRLFDEDSIEEEKSMPKPDSIERFYLENQFRCLIDEFCKDRKACARHIKNIHGNEKIPIEYVLAEFLLGELLALPVPYKSELFYSCLMLELCRFSPKIFTSALAQSIQILYDNLETMNVTCVERFVNWFAFHLNNYRFLWSWHQWQDCLSEDNLHPKPVFARELISRCIRISFYGKITALLKDSLAHLIPTEPALRDKYMSDHEIPGHQLALELKRMMINKAELPSYNSILNMNSKESGEIDETPTEHLMKIDVFTNVLMNVAAKTFTHLLIAIGKFQSIFKALMKTDDSKMQLLKSIHYTSKTNSQMQVILIDKLLKINLIDVCVVCDWIFTAEMSLEAMKFYPWEILNNAVSRQCKRKDVIIRMLEEAKDQTELEIGTIENLEEQLHSANTIEEKMFCIIFERFTKILSEHIHRCKSMGKDFKDHWFRWMIGHMQQVFFKHNKHIFCHVEAIESLTFASDMLDTHILLIFRQFLSLRA